MRTIAQIDAELARLKAEKRALKPVISIGPGFRRDRTWKPEGKGQRDPRETDAAFMAWLHVDTACIACLIEGPAPMGGARNPIEAAHQKLAIAAKGWREGGLGPRVHDHRCAPLCTWHHRLAPNSCDTGGQRKFWDRLGLGDAVADFCADLYAAFKADAPAMDVIRRYAAANDSTPAGSGARHG